MSNERQFSLLEMKEEVEREIIARKRSFGVRADAAGTVAWKMVETMKALADFLNRQIEANRTGANLGANWRSLDPGRAMPSYILAPALLSVLSRIPSGGYRSEVVYFGLGVPPSAFVNVYAYAELPAPAPLPEEPICEPVATPAK